MQQELVEVKLKGDMLEGGVYPHDNKTSFLFFIRHLLATESYLFVRKVMQYVLSMVITFSLSCST